MKTSKLVLILIALMSLNAISCKSIKDAKKVEINIIDTDGDGVVDNDDQCPNDVGTIARNGCPDADADGDDVLDKYDNCVNEVGPAENKGCPWPDSDGDGVLDKDDNCVDDIGPSSLNGCPENVITEAAKAKLDELANSISFNPGKSTFKPGVAEKLDLIAEIMLKFENSNFSIDGHTDQVGSNKLNQSLSESRAKAVLDYLLSKGIAAQRLIYRGFGEDIPITTNDTKAGRAKNRRVEINVIEFDLLRGDSHTIQLNQPQIQSKPNDPIEKYYYKELESFFNTFYDKYINSKHFLNLLPGKEIKIRAAKGEITDKENVRENIQIISNNLLIKPLHDDKISIEVTFLVGGKWIHMNPDGSIDYDVITKMGTDFAGSRYDDDVKAYIQKLYRKFEEFLKTHYNERN